MKKSLLTLFILFSIVKCYSQVVFENGYFIDNDGKKTECQIKNLDWVKTPSEFEYRFSDNDEVRKETIQSVKEFGVTNYSKHIRCNVAIDSSSNNLDHLSNLRTALYSNKVVFLKALVEGKANLYAFESNDLIRYFYSVENSNIEQLVYKLYKNSDSKTDISDTQIAENNQFRQQLINHLTCQTISKNEIEIINYNENDLIKLFVKYNQCENSQFVNYKTKTKKDLFNLTFRPRVNYNALTIDYQIAGFKTIEFENTTNLGFGIEAEFILSFNKNKWAVIIEPTYQYYKTEKQITGNYSLKKIEVDYKSVAFPIGIRHYMFLNKNSKLFVNGSINVDFPIKSLIIFDDYKQYALEIGQSNNLGFGFGYKFKDKLSLELRILTSRSFAKFTDAWSSDYNQTSFIFGYSIF